MNLLAKCKHQLEKSYWAITTAFVLKTNVRNWCNFRDNSWHRSVCSWAKHKEVPTHVLCCLKLRSLIWLETEKISEKKNQQHKPSLGSD